MTVNNYIKIIYVNYDLRNEYFGPYFQYCLSRVIIAKIASKFKDVTI